MHLVECWTPTGDGPVFTDEDESGGLGIAVQRDFEEGGTVKHDAGGISSFFVARGCGNGHYQRSGRPILVIKSRNPGAVVAHPDGTAGGDGHSPRVNEIWICVCRHTRNVGL